MRPDTKLKIARRRHTVELLRWLYSRRDAKVDGARLSLNHRERQEGGVSDSRSLTYGEVDVPDFLAILDIAKPREGEVFIDLGSGTGKAVLASSCGFPEFSKCLGIELVQGLVEAAADHLQTAKTFLSKPRPTSYGTPAQGNADNTLSTEGIAAETGVSPFSSLVAHRDERLHGDGGGSGSKGRGRGGGGRNGKAPGSKAASSRGLSAVNLEGLVADLLSRQPRPLPPPRSSQPLEVMGAGRDCNATARGEGEATAEEVASWLVRELGHRRYKDSLRGYGGLQKFLVARRKNTDRGAPSRITIAEDGSKVTAAPAEVPPAPAVLNLSRDGGDGSKGADGGLGACCGCTTGQGCAALRRCAEVKDAATATDASAVKTTEAAAATAGAAGAAASSAAADSVTSAVSSASSEREPLSGSAFTSSPARKETSTATPTSSSTSPSSSMSSSHASSPAAPDKPTGAISALEVIARAPDDGGSGSANGTERRRLPAEGPLTCESLSGVEMVCGDIFEEDWSDAGVVYVASLLFDDGMMVRLSKAAERLRQGARVISLRKIPTLTEDGEIPDQSGNRVAAPAEGGGIPSQLERGLPAPTEGGEVPSQSERKVPAPTKGGEIPSQSERVVPAPVEGVGIPSQSDRGNGGGLQGNNGSRLAPVRQPALRLLHEGVFRMSWQMARVYIYVRT